MINQLLKEAEGLVMAVDDHLPRAQRPHPIKAHWAPP